MNFATSLKGQFLKYPWIGHALSWLIFWVLNSYWGSLFQGTFISNLIQNGALLPIQIMAAYLLLLYQIPHLLLKKKRLLFFLSLIGTIYLFGFLGRTSIVYFAEPFTRSEFEQESLLEILLDVEYLFIVYLPAIYMPSLGFYIIKTIKERYEIKHQLEALQKEKAMTELKFLKAQIHPHFLFNTLNNLYALTLDKSDKAPEVVVKLSEMLDYILYQCSDPTIPIQKEIQLIQNYIDLELLRYGDDIDLRFNHHLANPNSPIAPLILLSIVENAFKHGASKNLLKPVIYIDLKVSEQKLFFKVFNTKAQIQNSNEGVIATSVQQKKGVGSTNIRKQLDLIYAKHYQMDIQETEADYTVTLNINLIEKV